MEATVSPQNPREEFPILDFDSQSEAIFRPNHAGLELDFPDCLVMCFFREIVEKTAESRQAKNLCALEAEDGRLTFYEIEVQGRRVAFTQARVGAPAAAIQMESAIAFGARHIVACGGCGVLDQDIACGKILLPVSAYREEGCSYHYLPPSAEVFLNPDCLRSLEETLKNNGINYLRTKTWTTDALYRETERKAAHYKALGCLAVEMETAALAAVAQFRRVNFGQYLYAGDAVVAKNWDKRDWMKQKDIRESLFWLSVEACLKLGEL